MPDARTWIISDVHLGAKHCQVERFLRFLERLPEDIKLVMNGDVVDHSHDELTGHHLEARTRLVELSKRQPVIWVKGNHDDRYRFEDMGDIIFADDHAIGKRLYVSHGYDFDTVMPYHRLFILAFRTFHHLRIRLGAESVHVARYAKKFKYLYAVLRKHVAMNAVAYGREQGYEAVTCGHTHYMEDVMLKGVRYINTGSWTEPSIYYVDATPETLALIRLEDRYVSP